MLITGVPSTLTTESAEILDLAFRFFIPKTWEHHRHLHLLRKEILCLAKYLSSSISPTLSLDMSPYLLVGHLLQEMFFVYSTVQLQPKGFFLGQLYQLNIFWLLLVKCSPLCSWAQSRGTLREMPSVHRLLWLRVYLGESRWLCHWAHWAAQANQWWGFGGGLFGRFPSFFKSLKPRLMLVVVCVVLDSGNEFFNSLIYAHGLFFFF